MIGSQARILFSLCFISWSVLAAPRPSLPPRPNFLLSYPATLKEQGQKLHHFLLRLEKNKPIPPRESAALAQLLAQSKEFAPFAWGPRIWHELTKKQLSFADVGPLCQEEFLAGQTDFLHPVNNLFYQQIEQRCQDLFLAYLKTFPATLAQYERQYLMHLLPILLNQHTDFLASFLAQSKTATFYPELKATMREEIISRKIPFPPALQEILDIPYAMDYSSSFNENFSSYNIDAYRHLQELYQDFRDELPRKDAPALARKTQELLTYCNQYAAQLPPNFRWVTLISTGKRLLAHQHHGAAIEAFTLATHALKEEQRQEAIFYLILAHLHQQDAASALKVIEQNNFLTDYVQLNSKYQFWVALTLERNGQSEKALQLFQNLIANGPISYYAIITLAHLYQKYPSVHQAYAQKLQHQEQITPLKINAYTPTFQQALRRLLVYLDLGLNQRAATEIEYLMGLEQEQALNQNQQDIDGQAYLKSLISNMSELLNFKKNYILAFKLLTNSLENRILDPDANIIKDLFPTQYLAQIKRFEKDVDPIIILSVIRQESAFNPRAKSAAGARGLMQLMPQTARNIKARTKRHHLIDPEINLKIGTQYFKQILEKQNGNLIYTLAAYNAGEHRLKEWEEEIFLFNDPIFTIEMIPYEETRIYVKLILRNIFFYALLFNNMQLENPIEKHLKPMAVQSGTIML